MSAFDFHTIIQPSLIFSLYSENTFNEDSSESIPKPPSSWMMEKQKQLDEEGVGYRSTDIKPRLAPEDDILYQWRLARRLEKAEKEAKGSQGKQFGNTGGSRFPVKLTGDRYDSCFPEQDHPRYVVDSESKNNFKARENKTFKHISKVPDRTLQDGQMMDGATDGVFSRGRPGVSFMQGRENIKCTERNKLINTQKTAGNDLVALESNVPAVCFIDEERLPSHVHMLCDIVPCSNQENRGVDEKNNFSAADFSKHKIERSQKPGIEFDSTDFKYHDNFRERAVINGDDVTEAHKTRELPSVSSNSDLTETKIKRRGYTSPRSNRKPSLHEKRDIPIPPVIHAELKTAEPDNVSETASSLENQKCSDNELNYQEKVDTVREKTMENVDADKHIKAEKLVENVESNDVTNLMVNTSTPMVSGHDARQKTDFGDKRTDFQSKGVIGTVIGQVSVDPESNTALSNSYIFSSYLPWLTYMRNI